MAVFLSYTNVTPYQPVTVISIPSNIEIDSQHDLDVVYTDAELLYLVIQDEQYDQVELRVENENARGSSLYISPIDAIGTPTHWGKQIILTNVSGMIDDFVYAFKYRWAVVNNIYFVLDTTPTATLNIYGVTQYDT